MKLSALQQSSIHRRNNSFIGSASLDSSVDGSMKSPAAIFWLLIQGLCCLISLVLGFRFSRLVFFLVLSTSSSNFYTSPIRTGSKLFGDFPVNRSASGSSSSRVVVGRHGIRIRSWPHPNPVEVMKAHQIIERVQREQKLQFGVSNPRKVIAVTPTYVRTFQMLHITGVMHSLMLVPYDLVWIVVEAGGVSNETASILAKSGLRTLHVGLDQRMPNTWEARHQMEVQMRLRALRIIRENRLDGTVMFADDSNMHTMELFDEIQKVKWFGALSVGILVHSSNTDESSVITLQKRVDTDSESLPIQGPACNSSNQLVGWHTFNSLPYEGRSAVHIDDRATVLPRKLEWSGFVLNSRLLWKEAEDKPDWMRDLDSLGAFGKEIESPLSLLKDPSVVEPLGSCGCQVMLWWLRVEARTDSKFPPRWIMDPPLEITVPAKHTPWPDTPPELPSTESTLTTQVQPVKHHMKTRASRSKRSGSKRKHEAINIDKQVPQKHTDRK